MIDAALVEKKLARIATSIRELRELVEPGEIERDLRVERFAEHTLQIAIQAAFDVASHIVSSRRLGEPRTNRELFELLARDGWLTADLLDDLKRMVGFRNLLVHGYEIVDPAVVDEVVRTRLGDLEAFATSVRSALGARNE